MTDSALTTHTLVVGGGFVGASIALRLQRAGIETVMVDPGDAPARASFGMVGRIATDLVEPLASWGTLRRSPGLLFAVGGPLDFRARDADRWVPFGLSYLAACTRFEAGTEALAGLMKDALPAWRRLAADAGVPELIVEKDHLQLCEASRAGHMARPHPLSTVAARDLRPEEVARLEACFPGRPLGGYAFSGAATVAEPMAVLDALHRAFAEAGGRVVSGRVEAVAPEVRLAEGRVLRAERIVVAAGAWSRDLFATLGVAVPLIAERGYHLQFADHDWPEDMPCITFEDRSLAITRFESGVRATSFTELGRPGAPPDRRKWARLRELVRELKAPVRGEGVEWMGSRPSLPDFLPGIGRLKTQPQVLYAIGHQHLGLTLAAVTAERVMAHLVERDEPEALKPFAI